MTALSARAGQMTLTVAGLAIAVWLWPLTAGVSLAALAIAAGMGYLLGVYRERSVTITQPTPRDAHRVAELERQLADTQALARVALLELHAARGAQPDSPRVEDYRVLATDRARWEWEG